MESHLTRRQQEIYEYLVDNLSTFPHPPTLDELCEALGLSSKGSMHKQILALIDAGLVEPMNKMRRGIRLISPPESAENRLPFLGFIAAGQPIEAIEQQEQIEVPDFLRTTGNCYVLQVRGDSMIDDGIFDGDHIVIEQRNHARNGEVVVALVEGSDATLKRIEQQNDCVTLHPANATMEPMKFHPTQVEIQGVLVGQMRRYH